MLLNKADILNDTTFSMVFDLPEDIQSNVQRLRNVEELLTQMSDVNALNEITFNVIKGYFNCAHLYEAGRTIRGLVAFHQIGYLNKDTVELIANNAHYIQDIKELFLYLNQTHLLSYSRENQKLIFKYAQYAKSMLPIFRLMIRADLFKHRVYEYDDRQFNFEMICQNAKYAKSILPLVERLNSVGLLLQSIVISVFENAEYSELINKILQHLNRLDVLTQSNCEKVFQNVKYAENILTALESLYISGLNINGLYQKDIVVLICECPEGAQNIVSIANCIRQVDINLLNIDNLRKIKENAKYSAAIASACRALLLGNAMTQAKLDAIFYNPKQAIFIAFENGGIAEKGNDGLEDFEKTQKVCKVFRETGAGLFFGKAQSEKLLVESPRDEDAEEIEEAVKFEDLTMFCLLPEEVLHNIASQLGNTLDEESRGEITRRICNAA